MSLAKRLNAKYGNRGKPTGDDKIMAEHLASLSPSYVAPEPPKPRRARKVKIVDLTEPTHDAE